MVDPADDLHRVARTLLHQVGAELEPDSALAEMVDAVLDQEIVHDLGELASCGGSLDERAALLAGAWLSGALAADPGEHWFHYWSSEFLRAGMPSEATRLRRELQERITLGINLRGRSDDDFLAARKQVDAHDAEPSESPSLDALRVALAVSSFCSADLPRALRLAGRCDGEGLGLLAVLAGAYYGPTRLRATWPRDFADLKEADDAGR